MILIINYIYHLIIKIFKKQYFLYAYDDEKQDTTYLDTYEARNMCNAMVNHFHPLSIDMKTFKMEKGYNELFTYYSFELDGKHYSYLMIKREAFEMYYGTK